MITADVRLPQGSGIAAVEAICDGRPIAVLFITATAWELRDRLRDYVVVEKPFAPAELNRGLDTALAARPPGNRSRRSPS